MEWVTILREQNSILNNILIPPIDHIFWTKVSEMQICDISRWHFKARKMDHHILLITTLHAGLMNEYLAKGGLYGEHRN